MIPEPHPNSQTPSSIWWPNPGAFSGIRVGKHEFVYHKSQMRRLLSILLVLFFSLGPLAATLEASDDAHLPACCRRHGAHHCSMTAHAAATMAQNASSETTVTAPATCPAFPGTAGATATAPHALAVTAVGLPALVAKSHAPAAARPAARTSQIRTRSGRAPPASSLA